MILLAAGQTHSAIHATPAYEFGAAPARPPPDSSKEKCVLGPFLSTVSRSDRVRRFVSRASATRRVVDRFVAGNVRHRRFT